MQILYIVELFEKLVVLDSDQIAKQCPVLATTTLDDLSSYYVI